MLNNDSDLAPLLAARKDLDDKIQILSDRLAISRKRRDAVQMAIDVLRSSDSELLDDIQPIRTTANAGELNSRKPRSLAFDVNAVEDSVLQLLAGSDRPLQRLEIERSLERLKVGVSKIGLKRILETSPKIHRMGERHMTCYELVKVQEAQP